VSILVGLTWLLAIFLLLVCVYRATFALAYLIRGTRVTDDDPAKEIERRFAIVIPAHDEELLIGDVLGSLSRVDYPSDRIRVHVIADNCSDETAERARSMGAIVFERNDLQNRGKGQALAWLLERLDLTEFDAVAFFDADNLVDPRFFRSMNRELAQGHRCLQGYYGISNPNETAMTRLLSVTYVMKNLLFNAGKTLLGLSVSLMGTGMVFHRDVIERYGWESTTIGEDLEQTLRLHEAGEYIQFVPDALSLAQEASTLRQGYTQRQRWASGRRVLAAAARSAIVRGVRNGSPWQIELGIELLMPGYSKLLNWTLAASVVSVALISRSPGLIVVVAAAFSYQVLEILVAMRVMGAGLQTLKALMFAPVFLVWKAAIDFLATIGYRRDAWVRTERAEHPGPLDSYTADEGECDPPHAGPRE
jgi:cellulose synthase/poly-beta-1,6-N-acetylglucosamine synthase-like glycosyltransferase